MSLRPACFLREAFSLAMLVFAALVLAFTAATPAARREGQAARAAHPRGDGGGVSRRRAAGAGGGHAAGDRRLQGRQGRRLHFLDPRYRRRAGLCDHPVRRHCRGRRERPDHRRQGDLPRRALHLSRRGAPAAARHLPRPSGGDAAAGRGRDAAAGFRQGRHHQRPRHARGHLRFGAAGGAGADFATGGDGADTRRRRLSPDVVERTRRRGRGGAPPHHRGGGGRGAQGGRRRAAPPSTCRSASPTISTSSCSPAC